MSGWVKVQEELLRDDLVLELEATGITPARCGGYDSRPYSSELDLYEGPRATGIKGVWRWWARAAMAGALGGVLDYREIDKKLEKVGILGSTESCSKLGLQIKVRGGDYLKVKDTSYKSVKRLNLLLRFGEKEEYLLTEYSLRIRIFKLVKELDCNQIEFGFLTLMLSLLFGGIGSITSRGFGSLKLRIIETNYSKIKKYVEEINTCKRAEELCRTIKVLSEECVDLAAKIAGEEAPKQIRSIPSVPCIDPEFKYFKVCVVEVPDEKSNPLHLLQIASKAVTKQEWVNMIEKRYGSLEGIPRCMLHTWVLGLPRKVVNKKKNIKTGYFYADSDRRQSPIRIRVLEANSGKKFVVILGFLSRDLPKIDKLKWRGGRGGKKEREVRKCEIYDPVDTAQPIKELTLTNVFNVAFQTVVEYVEEALGQCGRTCLN